MNESDEAQGMPRGVAARIGICLLNFRPGLGLIRLAHYRSGFAFIALDLVVLAGIAMTREANVQLTYERFIAFVAVAVAYALVLFGASVILSWRWSARISPRRGWLWRWYGLVSLLVLLAAISWLFRPTAAFNCHNFYAVSPSMAPTLERGDRLLAKMSDVDPISRGDVVIARIGEADWVKRVVGIPGDTVAMQSGKVILNGRPVPQQALAQVVRNDGRGPEHATRLREQFPGEASSHEILDFGPEPQDNYPPVKLGTGQYFLLGDNRDNTLDSRFSPSDGGIGLVDRSHITGRVLFRYWRKGVGLGDGRV